MTTQELLDLFASATKRAVYLGSKDNGVVIGLDQEGRFFYVFKGQVVSKVNIESIKGISDRSGYKNPGGDGLWPAPEGTCFGYEYATGNWEVPISLIDSRFIVTDQTATSITIEAEVDLINAQQLGIPTIFRRKLDLQDSGDKMTVVVEESIEYTGARTLKAGEFLLAPWSLCQFDWKDGDLFTFDSKTPEAIRDLYTDSSAFKTVRDGKVFYAPTEEKRYQIALGEEASSITLMLKHRGLKIHRTINPGAAGTGNYIDIADSPVNEKPLDKGIKFSFYSDPSHFLEIEAAGFGTKEMKRGDRLTTTITTTIAP